MLDIKFIRENSELVKKAIKDKQLEGTVDIDTLLELDARYRNVLQNAETHRALRNQLSKDVSKVTVDDREKLIAEATQVKEELANLEEELVPLKKQIDDMLLWVPQVPSSEVPYGAGEEDNVILRTEGKKPEFDFETKHHLELGQALDIIDVERGVKIAGFRAYFLKNDGLLLEQAVLKYALDKMKSKGFDLLTVPWMVRPEYFTGTGYFPWGSEDHYTTQDGLALIGTAEVSLTSYYSGEVLTEEQLPIKIAGVSPCYRREIGSYGKDTKGIFRVHQFQKVEQVVLLPEGEELSIEWHDKMLSYAEELLQELGLSYQVLLMCSGDMGAPHRKKYDINTWFPAQNAYRETHSDSYFLDFQARRLNMRYKTKTGDIKFVNTLNNTVAATPRLLASIIENYQQADGSIKIPQVLQQYMGKEIIRKK